MKANYSSDVEKIVSSTYLARLKDKTQVFILPGKGVHQTRFTHTIEVAKIARRIAGNLSLDEVLATAIALGHDLGHAPFGHVGEDTLNRLCPYGFDHAEQSFRIARNLGVSFEVQDGILKHSLNASPYSLVHTIVPITQEGMVVARADKIAYLNGDLNEALMRGVIRREGFKKEILKEYGSTAQARVDRLVVSMINESRDNSTICLPNHDFNAITELRINLFNKVYFQNNGSKASIVSNKIVSSLYTYFVENPNKLPLESVLAEPDLFIAARDCVSSMTNTEAIMNYKKINPTDNSISIFFK